MHSLVVFFFFFPKNLLITDPREKIVASLLGSGRYQLSYASRLIHFNILGPLMRGAEKGSAWLLRYSCLKHVSITEP